MASGRRQCSLHCATLRLLKCLSVGKLASPPRRNMLFYIRKTLIGKPSFACTAASCASCILVPRAEPGSKSLNVRKFETSVPWPILQKDTGSDFLTARIASRPCSEIHQHIYCCSFDLVTSGTLRLYSDSTAVRFAAWLRVYQQTDSFRYTITYLERCNSGLA